MTARVVNLAIPYNYDPRPYQTAFWKAMAEGCRRAVLVWHRRAGKDKTVLNFCISEMLKRVGTYYYFFPTYSQGKKILWDGIDRDGFKFMNHFPGFMTPGTGLVKSKNETEMQVELANGSIFQIIGTDRMDSIVGTNPVGCVFSEYALQNPRAWDLTRPILRENKGWSVFCYTPRGKNHGWRLYDMARKNGQWYSQLLTVDETGVVSKEDIEAERREQMDEDLLQQEYYCSFTGAVQGAYYSNQLKQAYTENRILRVPWESALPVYTSWDLGYDDSMSIWFYQFVGSQKRFVKYVEDSGEGFPYYRKRLGEEPYTYAEHLMPHDIEVHELGSGRTRKEAAEQLGIRPIRVAPKLGVHEGIDAVRRVFSTCYFDEDLCAQGLDCLSNYSKDYDEQRMVYKLTPRHDWASHGADAFRTFATGWRPRIEQPRIVRAETDFDPFSYDQTPAL